MANFRIAVEYDTDSERKSFSRIYRGTSVADDVYISTVEEAKSVDPYLEVIQRVIIERVKRED